jgi:hypothetical protein
MQRGYLGMLKGRLGKLSPSWLLDLWSIIVISISSYFYSKNVLFIVPLKMNSNFSKLKGTMSRDFLLLVFFRNQFPPSPRVFHSDRFEFFRIFAEIFASQGAPPVSTTLVANLPPVSATPVANFPPFSPVLLIPVANLPLVSTKPAANLPPVSTTPVANCHRYQRHRRQIMATTSGCRHLKVDTGGKP